MTESKVKSIAIIKNMLTLLIGVGGGKVIGLLLMPVIARLFTPDEFGALSLFSALILSIAPVLTMRYVYAIPLPKNDAISVGIVVLSLFIMVGVSLVLLVLIYVFGFVFPPAHTEIYTLQKYWWCLILGMWLYSIHEILSLWSLRMRRFKALSLASLCQATIGGAVKVLLGFSGFGVFGLIVGHLVQLGAGSFLLVRGLISTGRSVRRKITLKKLKLILFHYSDLPKYRLATQLLMVVSAQLPIFYVSWAYSLENAGQVGLALMTLSVPIQLFGTTMGKSFLAEISKVGHKNVKMIREITTQVVLKMAIVGFLGAALIYLTAPLAFTFVFGDVWQEAGLVARYLSIYLAFQFCYTSIGGVFVVVKKNGMQLINQIARTILVCAAFGASFVLDMSFIDTVIIYSVLLAISYVYGVFNVYAALGMRG